MKTVRWDRSGSGRIIARRGGILIKVGQSRHAFSVTEVFHRIFVIKCVDDLCGVQMCSAEGDIYLGTFRIVVARGSSSSCKEQ